MEERVRRRVGARDGYDDECDVEGVDVVVRKQGSEDQKDTTMRGTRKSWTKVLERLPTFRRYRYCDHE